MSQATARAQQVRMELQTLSEFFFLAAQECHGGARVAARLLLGMYNGNRFPFDLTDLRCLDAGEVDKALALLRFDARPQLEVHEWLNRLYGRTDFGARFEQLAHRWRMKGKCKKEHLQTVPVIAPMVFGGAQGVKSADSESRLQKQLQRNALALGRSAVALGAAQEGGAA